MPTRSEISSATSELGWRFVLGVLRAQVQVGSLAEAAETARSICAACGDDAGSLRIDLRPDVVIVSLQSPETAWITAHELDLAHRIAAVIPLAPSSPQRSVQVVEIAIDALDIPSVRPFWKAILGYADEPGASSPTDPIVDPLGQSPAIWFQQMDSPRPQRNRIHLDICVPHDEAPHRLRAALTAGGRLLSDAKAPAFWVLADPEGNEACITTWQGRDI